ncbi:MAG: glycosyltransferase [Candidatus Kapaibacterium sp.]
MHDRNALIIAYYFPPMGLSGVQRTLKFVKYLPEYGWKPIVLTSTPASYYAYDESLLDDIDTNITELHRTGAKNPQKKKAKFPSYFTQKIGRAVLQTFYQPDSKIKWKKSAFELGCRIMEENDINIIFATAPPFTDFLVARELSKKYDKPFVADYRDTWVDNPFHFYPTPFHKNYSIELEKDILTHASKVFVTTRHAKELILQRYRIISHNDIIILPHGYDPEDFHKAPRVERYNKKLVITHSGLFQDNRTPKYFLKALAKFIEENPEAKDKIEARFIGLMRPGHQKLIKKYGLDNNVELMGYLPHKEAVAGILASDVLWLMLFDTVRSPGKLYEYFGARKPLLVCAPEGIIRQTAEESGAAFSADPKNTAMIKEKLAEIYSLWKSGALPVPDASFTERYNRENITSDLARELSLAADF